MDQKTDSEIVARILEGDVQAYAQLVDAYKSPIYNLAFRMTASLSDAEDLTQDIFIRAYQKLYQFNRGKIFHLALHDRHQSHTKSLKEKVKGCFDSHHGSFFH